MEQIEKLLFENQDLKYRDFHAKLVPNINKDTIIGVRVPVLRKLAKEISHFNYVDTFLSELPHKYFEENHLHSFITSIKYTDIDELLKKIEEFLHFVDNWAICDSCKNKLFKKYPDKVLKKVNKWIYSNHIYTVRFGIVTLMNNFLDENFDKSFINLVSNIKSDEYYINMAISWFFCDALIKQYDSTIQLIESQTLPKFIQNKSIQKARESYRIDKETKDYLNTLKI